MDRNEKIYPFYRMFGYDYLFYMVISFLFFTITKGLSVGQLMYLFAFGGVFVALFQIPVNYIVEKIGLKKSMVLGNLFWIIHMIIIIFGTNFYVFVIAELICAIGTCLKTLSETQMLYASLKQTKNRKNFAKIEGRGVSLFYGLEAVSAVFVGFLFQINNYIPMVLTLSFGVISFVMAMCFDDIEYYKSKENSINQYLNGFKLVLKSKRIMSIFVFAFVMAGLVRVMDTIQKSTIVNLDVSAVEYSLIFAILTLCVGIGSRIQYRIETIVKRNTLKFISYFFTISILMLGIFNVIIRANNIALVISVAILLIQNILGGSYRISVKKYMNNFTTHQIRGKVLSVFYIFESTGKALLLFISGLIIDHVGTSVTTVIIGVLSIAAVYILIKYMKDRVGLNPEEYSKDDIYGLDIDNV